MKSNKIMFIVIGICAVIVICFCAFLIINRDKTVLSDALRFKQEFEEYNGATYSGAYEGDLINVSIPEDNPFIYKSAQEIIDVLHNEEAYILFGYATDPLIRNAIPVLIEALNERGITQVYYVDIEHIRDEYTVSWPPEKTKDGTDSYYEILDFFGDNLERYYMFNAEENHQYDTGVTRLYSPTFAAVRNDSVVAMHQKTVASQTDIYRELTDDEKAELKQYYLDVIDSLNEDSSEN